MPATRVCPSCLRPLRSLGFVAIRSFTQFAPTLMSTLTAVRAVVPTFLSKYEEMLVCSCWYRINPRVYPPSANLPHWVRNAVVLPGKTCAGAQNVLGISTSFTFHICAGTRSDVLKQRDHAEAFPKDVPMERCESFSGVSNVAIS